MTILSILLSAAAVWILGAGWYMLLAGPWTTASGVRFEGEGAAARSPLPFVLSFIVLLPLAAMLRYIMGRAGISDPGEALLTGLALGLCIAAPWIVMNNLYGQRPFRLSLIDGGYATFGTGVAALVLSLI